MPEPKPTQTAPPDLPEAAPGALSAANPDGPGARQARTGKRASLLSGMLRHVRRVGSDLVAVTLGRLLEAPDESAEHLPEGDEPGEGPHSDAASRRVGMLHTVTEQLRGAADSYLAAKLDEIEARVDEKLDHVEDRIDTKIVELHRQLAEMRDRELRHRLRLLKITLIFTVLVAALSLVYKWCQRWWFS